MAGRSSELDGGREEGEKTARDMDAQEERERGVPVVETDKVRTYGQGPGFQSLCRKNGP